MAWGNPMSRLWWSPTGCTSYPVAKGGTPSLAGYKVEGLFPGDGGLIATMYPAKAKPGASDAAVSLWQVKEKGT